MDEFNLFSAVLLVSRSPGVANSRWPGRAKLLTMPRVRLPDVGMNSQINRPRIFKTRIGRVMAVGVGLLFLSNGSGVAAERLKPGATLHALGYESIELRRTGDNSFYLFGKVEGRRRSCLIDTGWSFTTVSTQVGSELVSSNFVQNLTLGRVTLTNIPVRVEELRTQGKPTSYSIVLGAEFLQRQNAILDLAARKLYVRQSDLSAEQRTKLEETFRKAGWTEIKLRWRQPAAWTIRAQINNQPIELLLDSGASWNCLDSAVAGRLGLQVLPSLNQIAGPAGGVRKNISVTTVNDWRLGGTPMATRGFAVFDLSPLGLGVNGKLFPGVSGILGATELIQGRAVIDCGAGKLWWPSRK